MVWKYDPSFSGSDRKEAAAMLLSSFMLMFLILIPGWEIGIALMQKVI